MRESTLTLGLPHTNRWGLAEDALMKHAGHLQWSAIAETIGTAAVAFANARRRRGVCDLLFCRGHVPRRRADRKFSARRHGALPSRASRVQESRGRGTNRIRSRRASPAGAATSASGSHPSIRFGNIFITPRGGNSLLKVAAPANGDFSAFVPLPNEENPYQITRGASTTHRLGIVPDEWIAADGDGIEAFYAIDPDRDTNGAGLVYFANYFAFLESAERSAAMRSALPAVRDATARHLRVRRTAFYGNIDLDDRLKTTVSFFSSPADPAVAGVRYAMRRESDDVLICLSEAIKRCAGA